MFNIRCRRLDLLDTCIGGKNTKFTCKVGPKGHCLGVFLAQKKKERKEKKVVLNYKSPPLIHQKVNTPKDPISE